MHIFATAGHVDHGKSSLVAALTGTNPDRLKEEQIREMTIDLGFAFFKTPNGEDVGIIDVPGHIDFIDNMLTGMGGIEGALLVIAADEGIMPQTREHLAILNLLEVPRGIIVLTKVDLISDNAWLDLVEEDIRQTVCSTTLDGSPIVRFSAKTDTGLEELKLQIDALINRIPPRRFSGIPRLPIDRVFSIQGYGTVVTGTLLDGSFVTGEEVEILPGSKRTRIRGMQTHNQKILESHPGYRTAVNLANIGKDEIARGDVLVRPGTYYSTNRMDVAVQLQPGEGVSIKHNEKLKLFCGTAHRVARVRLLGEKKLNNGAKGYLQLELDIPICAKAGDHFILRRASPSITVGGGVILDVQPRGRHKLHDERKINQLRMKENGSLSERILAELDSPITPRGLSKKLNIAMTEFTDELDSLITKGRVVLLDLKTGKNEDVQIISNDMLQELSKTIITVLQELHKGSPLRKGFSDLEILKLTKKPGIALEPILDWMVTQGTVKRDGLGYCLQENAIKLSPAQEKSKRMLWDEIDQNPFSPPTYQECAGLLGKDLLQSLIDQRELVRVSEEIVFRKDEFDQMLDHVKMELDAGNPITVSGLRDRFGNSRKYALPFLEYLDRIKITRRVGDERVRF